MIAPDPLVFVVDDDASARRAIARLLGAAGHTAVACASAEAFLEHTPCTGPACVVLDVRLPGLSGPELQKKLLAAGLRTPVIFLSGHGDIPMSVRAMKAGAADFLTKPVEDEVLLEAVDRALALESRAWQVQATVQEIRARVDSLTAREHEVLDLVVTGRRNKQIAAELGIAEKTVKVHRARMMRKMRGESVAHLVRLTERAGKRRRDD